MKKAAFYVIPAIVVGTVVSGTIAEAATKYVQAVLGTSSVYVNGQLQSSPPKLVYKGTTYVQLSSIQHSLIHAGIGATWDGNKFKMTIPYEPPAPGPNVSKIQDMKTLTVDQFGAQSVNSFTDNLGGQYNYGGIEVSNEYGSNAHYDATYLLNGEYKELKGTLVPSIDYSKEQPYSDLGELQIIGDGQTLYDSGAVASNITKPIQVDVNLAGVTQLEVILTMNDEPVTIGNLGFVNAEFLK
jgi:hypothetical protein